MCQWMLMGRWFLLPTVYILFRAKLSTSFSKGMVNSENVWHRGRWLRSLRVGGSFLVRPTIIPYMYTGFHSWLLFDLHDNIVTYIGRAVLTPILQMRKLRPRLAKWLSRATPVGGDWFLYSVPALFHAYSTWAEHRAQECQAWRHRRVSAIHFFCHSLISLFFLYLYGLHFLFLWPPFTRQGRKKIALQGIAGVGLYVTVG